jgi:hypothetical protein
LKQRAANHFLVTATTINGQSPAKVVSTITDIDLVPLPPPPPPPHLEPLVAHLVKRKKGKSVVEVRGAETGMLVALLGPYAGKVQLRQQDVNHDGMADLVIQSMQNGKKRQWAYDGLNLASRPVPQLSKKK